MSANGEVDIDYVANTAEAVDAVNQLADANAGLIESASDASGSMSGLSQSTSDAGMSFGSAGMGALGLLYSMNTLLRTFDRYNQTVALTNKANETLAIDTQTENDLILKYTNSTAYAAEQTQKNNDIEAQASAILATHGENLQTAALNYQQAQAAAGNYLTLQQAELEYSNQLVTADAARSAQAVTAINDMNRENQQLLQMGINLTYAGVGIAGFAAKIPGVGSAMSSLGGSISEAVQGFFGMGEPADAAGLTAASASVEVGAAGVGMGATVGIAAIAVAGIVDVGYKVSEMIQGVSALAQSGSNDWTQYAGVVLTAGGAVDELSKSLGDTESSSESAVAGLRTIESGLEAVASAAGSAWNWLSQVFSSGGSTGGGNPNSAQGGYALGTNDVPATGYYLLHEHEAVIPAAQNQGGGGNGGPSLMNFQNRTVVQMDGNTITSLLEKKLIQQQQMGSKHRV